MKNITLRHEINCNVDRFWEVFFDKEFNRALFIDDLKFPEFEVLKQENTNGQITRTVRGKPKMNVPKPVRKLLGDSFGYEESGTFSTAKGEWVWKMHPNTMADKLFNSGIVTCERIGDDRCRRVAEITMEAKVFGVGKLIEKSLESEMRTGWDNSAVFMNHWLIKNG